MILGISDHDMLIQLTEQVSHISTLMNNHLEHHFWYAVTLLSIVGGLVATLLVMALKKK
jgi:hypothetical protein